MGVDDEFEAAPDASRVVEGKVDAAIQLALSFVHLVVQIVADEFIEAQPDYFVAAIALQEEQQFLLHEAQLGEIVYWMAD